MKKILITLLIILTLSLAVTVVLNGFDIATFSVYGIEELGGISENLDSKISQATTLTSVTFPEKLSALNAVSKQLITTKEQYQDKVAYSSEEDVRKANEIETYQVDFLFTRLGNHAKKYGLVLDLDANLTSATGVYNLNITLHGKYSLIADFVRAVENDSDLTFTIEKFILTPDSSTETLKAEFVITDIRLDVDENITNSTTVVSMGSGQSTDEASTNTTTNTATNATANTATTTNTASNTGANNTANNAQ